MTQRQIVFVAGSGHSGSTLLDMCLGGHADIAALGETGFLHFYAHRMSEKDFCTCGKTIYDCPFWSKVIEKLASLRGIPAKTVLDDFVLADQAQVRFDEKGNYIERLPHQKRINESILRAVLGVIGSGALFRFAARFSKTVAKRLRIAENRKVLFDAVQQAHGKNVVLDSTKNAGTLKDFWMTRGDVQVKFIVMQRDGRGVTASHMRRLGLKVGQAAAFWRNEVLKWHAVALTIPSSAKITVRYEDFCAAPAAELKRVCDFIGVSYDPAIVSFRDDRHNLGGNQMRFRKEETAIRLDEKWRRELDKDHLAQFDKTAGWLNAKLGYK